MSSMIHGHCVQCGRTVPLMYEDLSFDHAFGTKKEGFWKCCECDTTCEPHCVPDIDEPDPEFDEV